MSVNYPNLKNRHKRLSVFCQKKTFLNVDNHNIVDIIKETYFTTIFSLVIVIPIFVAKYFSYSITFTSSRLLTPVVTGQYHRVDVTLSNYSLISFTHSRQKHLQLEIRLCHDVTTDGLK